MANLVQIFFRQTDLSVIFGILGEITVRSYEGRRDILTAIIESGKITELKRNKKGRPTVVLGKEGLWEDRAGGKHPFIRIRDHPVLGEIYITSYSEMDVRFHLKTQTIDRRVPGAKRIEYDGTIKGAFFAYAQRTPGQPKVPHLIIYRPLKQEAA